MAIPELTQEKTNTLTQEEQQDAQIIEINEVIHALSVSYFNHEKRIAALEKKKKR